MSNPFRVYLPSDSYKELFLYDSLFHPKISAVPTPTPPPGPPSYSISCDNNITQDLVVSNPTMPFLVVPATVSTGIANIIFLDNSSIEITNQTITFASTNPILIIPPENTVTIQYIFKCSPGLISLICPDTQTLDPTLPYSFENQTVDTIQLTLTNSGGSSDHTLSTGDIYSPSPLYGYTGYSTVCIV